jgi:hypothetical protein
MLVTIYREREAAYMLRSLLEGPRHVRRLKPGTVQRI